MSTLAFLREMNGEVTRHFMFVSHRRCGLLNHRSSEGSSPTVDREEYITNSSSKLNPIHLRSIWGLLHPTPAIEMPPEAENEPAAAPVAVFKRRGAKGKANIRKRPATPPPANSDSDSDYSSSEDEAGHRVKRRKKTATVTATSKDHVTRDRDLAATTFAADRNAAMSTGNDATKSSNWFDEGSKDELSAKNLLGSTRSGAKTQDAAPDGNYKGLANQTSFIQKRTDAPSRTVGPVKAPTNIRTITITDYAPDVCKDYKQTGFVSYFPAPYPAGNSTGPL
jgi:hypothetical protein